MSARVTIGMSVLNAERTLEAAIASVRAQTLEDWRLLIADDGSTDRSLAIAREAAAADTRIRAFEATGRHGTATRLNELVDMAETPLFARMDADDVSYPSRLEQQVAFLDGHKDVDLVGSEMVVFGSEGRAIGKRTAPAAHAAICARPASGFRLFHPTWVGGTGWLRRFRYDPAAIRCEDQDLLYRAYRTSTFANLTVPLVGYREDRLAFRRISTGRLNLTRRTTADLWRRGERLGAVATVVEQIGKAGADAVAMGTGLDHRLLRHRAGRMSDAERAEWDQVWASSSRYTPASSSASTRSENRSAT
jgi:glycosyltransferase involved in cell wall biosynthesis